MPEPPKKPRRIRPPAPPPPSVPSKARAPAPDAGSDKETARDKVDPTRYGDWEKNGRCIDF